METSGDPALVVTYLNALPPGIRADLGYRMLLFLDEMLAPSGADFSDPEVAVAWFIQRMAPTNPPRAAGAAAIVAAFLDMYWANRSTEQDWERISADVEDFAAFLRAKGDERSTALAEHDARGVPFRAAQQMKLAKKWSELRSSSLRTADIVRWTLDSINTQITK